MVKYTHLIADMILLSSIKRIMICTKLEMYNVGLVPVIAPMKMLEILVVLRK